jgi:hypothetical protein
LHKTAEDKKRRETSLAIIYRMLFNEVNFLTNVTVVDNVIRFAGYI